MFLAAGTPLLLLLQRLVLFRSVRSSKLREGRSWSLMDAGCGYLWLLQIRYLKRSPCCNSMHSKAMTPRVSDPHACMWDLYVSPRWLLYDCVLLADVVVVPRRARAHSPGCWSCLPPKGSPSSCGPQLEEERDLTLGARISIFSLGASL